MESVTRELHLRQKNCTMVLNAFRHHGIGHVYCSKLPGWRYHVLNAFRHHGIGHFLHRINILKSPVCSTPSGIMESVTPDHRYWRKRALVLNAFRHHGIGHRGINDWATLRT